MNTPARPVPKMQLHRPAGLEIYDDLPKKQP